MVVTVAVIVSLSTRVEGSVVNSHSGLPVLLFPTAVTGFGRPSLPTVALIEVASCIF